MATNLTFQPMRVELEGDNVCFAGTMRVRSNTPVLAMCRLLVRSGIDPSTPLEVYRGSTLALRVRSIGEAAKLTVREDDGPRGPRFVKWVPYAQGVAREEEKAAEATGGPPARETHGPEKPAPQPNPLTSISSQSRPGVNGNQHGRSAHATTQAQGGQSPAFRRPLG